MDSWKPGRPVLTSQDNADWHAWRTERKRQQQRDPERRAKQAALIRTWQPWQQATGPRSSAGKHRSSRNAWRGGYRPTLRAMVALLANEIQMAGDLVAIVPQRHGDRP